jgi:hypothetical protein
VPLFPVTSKEKGGEGERMMVIMERREGEDAGEEAGQRTLIL